MAAIRVETTKFQFSHRRQPKGFGSWAFQIGKNPEPYFVRSSSYSDARKAAQQEAAKQGASCITVLP